MSTYDYKCSDCGNIQEENHSYRLITHDYDDYCVTLKCLKCGMIGNMKRKMGNSGLATFSMASPEDKKTMLKERSHKHFKKDIEEKFHLMNKTVLKK